MSYHRPMLITAFVTPMQVEANSRIHSDSVSPGNIALDNTNKSTSRTTPLHSGRNVWQIRFHEGTQGVALPTLPNKRPLQRCPVGCPKGENIHVDKRMPD
jgi:hypothetical protein